MEQQRRRDEGNTVSQLKADIDAGRTGDKVAAGDPGLSPLGTDDEAAGRPASPARVAMAREQEKAIGAIATANDKPKTNGPILLMIGVIAVIAAVAVLAFYFSK